MVSLGAVVRHPSFHLTHVSGPPGVERTLTGAHSSEQLDPTPFLGGGELLMLDGLMLGDDRAGVAAYVDRLHERGIVALAFGVSERPPFHAAVPRLLVEESTRAGMPLYSVPDTTPFIAITKFLYGRMADESHAVTRQVVDGQRKLTAAAARVRPLDEVLRVLQRSTGVQCSVLDLQGRVLAGRTRPGHDELARQTSAHGELHAVSRTDQPGLRREAHPLGTLRTRAVAVFDDETATGPRDPVTRKLVAFASTLLSIEVERRHVVRRLERRPGSEALRRLIAGLPAVRAAQLAASVGLRSELVRAVRVEDLTDVDQLLDDVADVLPESLSAAAESAGAAVLAVPAESEEVLSVLDGLLAERHAGIGAAVPPHHFPASVRQARHAVATSRKGGCGLVDATRLGSVQVLLQLGSHDAVTTFADSVLGPIAAASNPDQLEASLRAFLEADGVNDRAAALAHVHRHTLRHHLRQIEDLTGRSLDSTRDRAELFLAFEARDLSTPD